jgi:hypothetical protein
MITEVSEQLFRVAGFNPLDFPRERSELDLRGWIANPYYYVESADSKTSFVLNVREWEKLNLSLSNDVNRFAIASVESLVGIRRDPRIPRHSAWPIIRAYYAAFYAAHAIVRLFGRSLTQLDTEHAKILSNNARTVGSLVGTDDFASGFFRLRADPHSKTLHFNAVRDSHADTWHTLYELFVWLREELKRSKGLSQRILLSDDFLESLIATLTFKGCNRGNWLSSVRNSVNYRFGLGSWFPFESGSGYTAELMERDADYLQEEIDPRFLLGCRNEVHRMFKCCVILVKLCQSLIDVFCEKASSIPYQMKNGVLRFRKQIIL